MESFKSRELIDEELALVRSKTGEHLGEPAGTLSAVPVLPTPDASPRETPHAHQNGALPEIVRQPLAKADDIPGDENQTGSVGPVNIAIGRRLMARDLGRDRVADFTLGWTTV